MQAVLMELDKEGVKYKIGQDGKTVSVPENVVADLRLKLAAKGIPNKGILGYEIFDKSSFAISDFQQQVNFKRAIEGELARTILKLSSIEDAKVNIALPEKSIFVREEEEPSASVFVKVKPGYEITKEQVIAIRNLVAASVPKLKPQNVVVIDDKGIDLTSLLEDEEDIKVSEKELKLKLEYEKNIEKKVQAALESTLGFGKVKVRVNADLDFSKFKQKEELFDPDMTAVVSQQKKKERTEGPGTGGIPGAQANIPPGAGVGAAGQFVSEKSETITNYEVSKKETYTEGPNFRVKRLSVGVLLDANLKDIDLNKVRNMVVASAGIDFERGDVVSVEALPFQTAQVVPEKLPYEVYIKYALLALLLVGMLGIVFFALRRFRRKEEVPITIPTPTLPPEMEEVREVEELRAKARELVTVDAIAKATKTDAEKVAKVIKSWLRSK